MMMMVAGAALAAPAAAVGAPTEIDTVAGTSSRGFFGDGGPATSARLAFPWGVAVDSADNLYIADSANNRIRKVNGSGTITTVAGTGVAGFSGDAGPATSAELNDPGDVAVDTAGNLYIADFRNHRVRKVNGSGTITTVAGNGVQGFSGDGGPATAAKLDRPSGVGLDSAGNLYIADSGKSRVRKVNGSGKINTVAGNGVQGFSGDGGPATKAKLNFPVDVAADGSGNLFISDSGNSRIRKVNGSGRISTVVGATNVGAFSGDGGPATKARLSNPSGKLAVDNHGNLYIADHGNNRVRKVNGSGTITTVAGTGTPGFSGGGGLAIAAPLDRPIAVALDTAGDLYVADASSVREVEGGDNTRPQTTFTGGPIGITNDPTPSFGFAAEIGASFGCKIDSGGYRSCRSPSTASHLTDGPHTFSVRATDRWANTDSTPAQRAFTVKTAEVSVNDARKTLRVTAAPGAGDNIVVSRPSTSTLRVTDLAAGPYAGSGLHTGRACTRKSDYTARCDAAGITLIKIAAGDQADRVVNSTPIKSSVNGGAGDDTLVGGSAKDTLAGDQGADLLQGLGGDDLLAARDGVSDTLIDCGAGTDRANLDSHPLDPDSVVKGCETKAR